LTETRDQRTRWHAVSFAVQASELRIVANNHTANCELMVGAVKCDNVQLDALESETSPRPVTITTEQQTFRTPAATWVVCPGHVTCACERREQTTTTNHRRSARRLRLVNQAVWGAVRGKKWFSLYLISAGNLHVRWCRNSVKIADCSGYCRNNLDGGYATVERAIRFIRVESEFSAH